MESMRGSGRISAADWARGRGIQGLPILLGRTALLEKIGPDEAEPEGFGDSKVEGENEV
jgi:hypothetical protein